MVIMDPEILLRAEGICFEYQPNLGIQNIECQLNRGEVMGLLGPNGAGKTSLLNILAGLLTPDRGRVTLLDQALIPGHSALRRHLGYLPDRPPLYAAMTVAEYLRHVAHLRLIPSKQIKEQVADALSRCGLNALSTRLIKSLSKGLRQRVGIAQAIIHRPEVILLDEPMDGLDPIQILEVRELIRELGQTHAIVFSSHGLTEVTALCQKALILNKGKTVFYGSLDQLNTNTQALHLWVRFEHAVTEIILRNLPGVERLQVQNPQEYILRTADRQLTNQALLEATLKNGWRLSEIRPYHIPLETFFEQLPSEKHVL